MTKLQLLHGEHCQSPWLDNLTRSQLRNGELASLVGHGIDVEIDARLDRIESPHALALRGRAALAQANAAYHLFRLRFSGPRWDALAARGARVQRPLWASTSTKNPRYPDTMYVDGLIAPDTVTTLTETTIAAFEDHGRVARGIEDWTDDAFRTLEELAAVGIDFHDVSARLEDAGIVAFAHSFEHLLATFGPQWRDTTDTTDTDVRFTACTSVPGRRIE